MINPEVTKRLAEIDAAVKALAALVPSVADPPPVKPPPVEPPPVEPPSGTIPALSANPSIQPSLEDGVFLTPVAVEKGGQWTLYLTAEDKYGSAKLTAPITVRYILDGVRLGTVVADPAVSIPGPGGWGKLHAPLAIAKPSDGVHGVSLRILGPYRADMRVLSSDFSVGTAPAVLPSYRIPVHGHVANSSHWARAVYDEIVWPGGNERPQQTGKPRGVTLPPGMTEAGLNPKGMTPINQFWVEPLNQFGGGLYFSETDYRKDRNGWVRAKGFTWQAGTHSAPAATTAERRKPEYNGPRLANQIDGYSTFRFGDKHLWVISLRGTLSRVDLETGEKKAVAGRVYKTDSVALDHFDDAITQAQIDAANYEFLGDAANPEHLDWTAPHDFYPAPWDADNQGLLLDSLKHRLFWIDASVSPAKVTLLVGNGAGRVPGPIAQAKINRPYAAVVYPDRRIVVCCTPPAGQEQDSAIIEIDAAWQNVREIIGPDKTTRPFWLCEHEPGYVVYWELTTGRINRLNTETGEVAQWAKDVVGKNPMGDLVIGPFLNARPDGWGQVVCDLNGTIGERYNVYFLTSQASTNTEVWVFGRDGMRIPGLFLKTSIGVAPQGPAETVFDLPAHYPWAMDIHRVYGCGVIQGFGNTAPIFFRRKLPLDPKVSYEHNTYGLGRQMYWNGSLPGFPCDLRPSGRGLRSGEGHSTLGNLPSLQHVLAEGDNEVLAYMRAGAGGSVPRPEWDGEWGKLLLYWLRWHDDDLRDGLKPPVLAKKPAPKLLSWGSARDADGVTVSFTTDKPTFCCLTDGNGSVASDAYKTAHTLRLLDCGLVFSVLIADLDRNMVGTDFRAA